MTPTQPTSTVTATQETATPQATETPTAQPSNTPTPTPTIQLAISKEAPEIALAGAPITYVLTVRNISQIHASNITVVDTLPAAATYLASPGGLLLAETNQVQWSIAALPPGATIQVQLIVSATHTLINSEYKAEIPGVHQVIGSEPVLTLIGQETTTGAVEAETGGSLTSSSGDLSVAVPAGAITSPVTLTIVTLGEPLNQAGFSGIAFSITAIDSIGNKIAQFGQPLTLTFRYTDADWQNAGISDERAMNLYFWDSLAWRPLLPCAGCSQDLESNTFTVLVDHLTLFALRQSPGQIYLPLVQN